MAFNTTLVAKNRGQRAGKIEFIVLHDTAGAGDPTGEHDASYLAHDPEHRSVSVDFVIGKDGTVWQLNQDLKGHCTYHAGRHTSFRGRTNGMVNQHSVGIEISQKAQITKQNPPYYPDAQVKAVADVCEFLCNEFSLNEKDITTHAAIITDHSRTDPRLFPWDKFWEYFRGEQGTDGLEVQHSTLPGPVTYTVRDGDTLWGIANTYHTSVEQLKALNGMNTASNVIKLGQVLKIKD